MSEGRPNLDPIVTQLPAITAESVEAFRHATGTRHLPAGQVPLTYVTLFRAAEFEFVDRLTVSDQAVLHAEQEYRMVAPLQVGDEPLVSTSVKSLRSRAGMTFLVMESTISCSGQIKLESTTTFVIRELKGDA